MLSLGQSSSTCLKAWESVMIRSGGSFRAASMAGISVVLQQLARHPLSSRWRMVCTWGRMSLPLGASISWGMTRSTLSPALVRLPVISSRS